MELPFVIVTRRRQTNLSFRQILIVKPTRLSELENRPRSGGQLFHGRFTARRNQIIVTVFPRRNWGKPLMKVTLNDPKCLLKLFSSGMAQFKPLKILANPNEGTALPRQLQGGGGRDGGLQGSYR